MAICRDLCFGLPQSLFASLFFWNRIVLREQRILFVGIWHILLGCMANHGALVIGKPTREIKTFSLVAFQGTLPL